MLNRLASTHRDFLGEFSKIGTLEVGDDVSPTLLFELCAFFLLKSSSIVFGFLIIYK
jgi:hypothetical protein